MVLLTKYQWVIVQRGFPHRVVALGKSRAELAASVFWMSIARRYGHRRSDYQTSVRCRANGMPYPAGWTEHGMPPKKCDSGKYDKSLKWNRPSVKRCERHHPKNASHCSKCGPVENNSLTSLSSNPDLVRQFSQGAA